MHRAPVRNDSGQEALPAQGSGALIAKQVTASLSQLSTVATAALEKSILNSSFVASEA